MDGISQYPRHGIDEGEVPRLQSIAIDREWVPPQCGVDEYGNHCGVGMANRLPRSVDIEEPEWKRR